jgi:hypothetical protein
VIVVLPGGHMKPGTETLTTDELREPGCKLIHSAYMADEGRIPLDAD